jgi:nitronate monooxygenase
MWPDRRLLDLLRIEHPIIQAPMAGAMDFELAAAVSEAGGLGSLPAAMLTPDQLRDQITQFRSSTRKPLNVNFFCHVPPKPDAAREARWREQLAPYYREYGLDPTAATPFAVRAPFNEAFCNVVEETRPEVVSFHFGLPSPELMGRVKAIGAAILSSATHVGEARWLAERGVDAIIAQGLEAGGHRGIFLTDKLEG